MSQVSPLTSQPEFPTGRQNTGSRSYTQQGCRMVVPPKPKSRGKDPEGDVPRTGIRGNTLTSVPTYKPDSTWTPLGQGNFQSNKPSTCREHSTGPRTSPRPRWGWAAPAVPSGDGSLGPTWGRISAAAHPFAPSLLYWGSKLGGTSPSSPGAGFWQPAEVHRRCKLHLPGQSRYPFLSQIKKIKKM